MDETRELAIPFATNGNEQLYAVVTDNGVGLPRSGRADFNASLPLGPWNWYGTSDSRSILESHGGRLWAASQFSARRKFLFHSAHEDEVHE